MPRLNHVVLIGRLTYDPEIRYLPSGTPVTSFAIAVNERYRRNTEVKEEVSYFDVVVFGKAGENCAEYLSKGRAVLVEGRLRQRRWEADGLRRSKVEIIADNVQFLAHGSGPDAAQDSPQDAPHEDVPF